MPRERYRHAHAGMYVGSSYKIFLFGGRDLVRVICVVARHHVVNRCYAQTDVIIPEVDGERDTDSFLYCFYL
jgi:hypothetical protein